MYKNKSIKYITVTSILLAATLFLFTQAAVQTLLEETDDFKVGKGASSTVKPPKLYPELSVDLVFYTYIGSTMAAAQEKVTYTISYEKNEYAYAYTFVQNLLTEKQDQYSGPSGTWILAQIPAEKVKVCEGSGTPAGDLSTEYAAFTINDGTYTSIGEVTAPWDNKKYQAFNVTGELNLIFV